MPIPMRANFRALNFRRLAAINFGLRGYKFILAEYAGGVGLSSEV
jgi:hypothetical protein